MTTQIPHSAEAEQATLGAIIINPDAIHELSWLKPEHFYIARNKFTWEAMLSLTKRNVPIDMITLNDELQQLGHLADVGDTYAYSLLNHAPSSYNVDHYARIVADYAQRRGDIQIANAIAQGAYGDGVNRSAIIDLLTRNTTNPSGAAPLSDFLDEYYTEVEERSKNPCEIWGISTGLPSLDKATGGLQSQQTTMLAGSPGVGKTTILLQILLEAAKRGTKTAIYELEMDTMRLISRSISMLTGVPVRNMKTGKMDGQWDSFTKGIELLSTLPFYICDNPTLDTSQIRADVARLKNTQGLDLVGLDYLNLLTDRESSDDNQNTTAKAKRFRQICREFKVSGVSVQSITKEGMRAITPNLADMSGPAEVGFNADNVFFLVQDADQPTQFSLLPAKMRDSDNGRKPISLVKPQGKIMFGEMARY